MTNNIKLEENNVKMSRTLAQQDVSGMLAH